MLSILVFMLGDAYAVQGEGQWETLECGIEFGCFQVDNPSPAGDQVVRILRIDPNLWDIRLFCASQIPGCRNLTARQWCESQGLRAAINAGMFDTNYCTHIGFLSADDHVNNSSVNSYQSVAVFSPRREDLAPFRIFDLDTDITIGTICQDYRYVVQNLRLIKRWAENRWSPQGRIWSEAALGEDDKGRVLFIFCRSPYSMHELNGILMSLHIGLVCAQHLEGGPEAQMYFNLGKRENEFVGSYETRFKEDDLNRDAWAVPNVIGIRRVVDDKDVGQ